MGAFRRIPTGFRSKAQGCAHTRYLGTGFKNPLRDCASAFNNLRAGCFEDLTLARGQAVDAVRGNFVENRIHFLADEFFGRQFRGTLFPFTATCARDLGGGLDELTLSAATLPKVPVEVRPRNVPTHVSDGGQNATDMRGMSNPSIGRYKRKESGNS